MDRPYVYAEEASQTSGIREIWEASEFEPFLRALRNRQPYRPKADKISESESATPVESSAPFGFEKLFVEAGKNDAYIYLLVPGMSDSLEYRQEQRFASEWFEVSFRLQHQECVADLCGDAFAEVSARDCADAARDRHQH